MERSFNPHIRTIALDPSAPKNSSFHVHVLSGGRKGNPEAQTGSRLICGKAYSSVDQLRERPVAVTPKMEIHCTLLDAHDWTRRPL